MPACDGKVMKDERGADVIPCECRFKICRDCLLDAQKESGICPRCKESYRMGDYDDNSHDFSSGALPLPAPDGSKRDPKNMSMMKRNQKGDFDHNQWLFETKGTYGVGNTFWPQDDVYGDDGDEGLRGSMIDAMGRRGKTPTIVIVWSGLIAITLSLLWIAATNKLYDGYFFGFSIPLNERESNK